MGSPPPRRIGLIVNAHAFAVRSEDADRVVRLCRENNLAVVDVVRPESAEGMASAARAFAGAADGVLVLGGDGAVNATLPGCLGRTLAIGMVPRGTVNVWAREIGLPVRPDLAVPALAAGHVESVDVGRVLWPASGRETHFLLMAGLGFDGEVSRLVNRRLKRFVGLGAYVVASLAAYFQHEPYHATVQVDGRSHALRLTQLVVANCRRYGGDLPLAASADASDGWLDLWTLGPAPRWQHGMRFFKIVALQSDPGDRLLPVRARSLRVESDHAIALQIDGDPVPHHPGPIEISVLPASLRVWLPRRG